MTTHKIKIGDTWYPVNEVIAVAGGGGVTAHGLLSGLEGDDHTQYLNNARGDARYDAAGTASNSVTAHHAASSTDHDDRYYTEGEVEGRLATKENQGTASALVNSHVGAADPHTVYLLKAGDTMSGDLHIEDVSSAALGVYMRCDKSALRIVSSGEQGVGWGDGLWVQRLDPDGIITGLGNVICDPPVHETHAATKGYADSLVYGDGKRIVQSGYNGIPWTNFEAGSTLVFTIPFFVPFIEVPVVTVSVRTQFNSGDGYYNPAAASPSDHITVQVGNRNALGSVSVHVHAPEAFNISNAGWAVEWVAVGRVA